MSDLSLSTNFLNNIYVNKISTKSNKNVSFKGNGKDEFIKTNSSIKTVAEKLKEGITLYHAGNYAGCIEALNQTIENSTNPPARAFHCKASAERLLGRYDEAIADYTKAIEISPDSINSIKLRGRTNYLKAVKEDLKGEAFKNAIADSISDYNRALELKPEPDTYKFKAESYMALGKWADAELCFDEGIELAEKQLEELTEKDEDSKAISYTKGILADMHHIDGTCLVQMAEKYDDPELYGEAVIQYSKALELCPYSLNTLKARGKASHNYAVQAKLTGEEFKTEIDNAISDFDNALKFKFDNSVLKDKISAYMSKGDWENALEDLEYAYAYDKKELKEYKKAGIENQHTKNLQFELGNTSHLKGNCLRHLGRFDEAHKEYSRALNYVPSSPNTYKARGRALYFQANSNQTEGIDKNKLLYAAINDYNSALAMRKDGEALRFKAEAYMRLHDYKTAIACADEGIKFIEEEIKKASNGKTSKKQITLANLYATKGDCLLNSATNAHSANYGRAKEAYTKAIEIVPDCASLYYARAKAGYHVNSEECIEDIRTAIDLDHNRPEYWDFLSRATAYSEDPDEVMESCDAMVTAMYLRNGGSLDD